MGTSKHYAGGNLKKAPAYVCRLALNFTIHLEWALLTVLLFPQYPLPELVVIHQQQKSLDDVLSLETYIKQAWHSTVILFL